MFIIEIKKDDFPEFAGQIIDIFEDFLEAKGIDILNEEKEEEFYPAILFGSDYDQIETGIRNLLENWGIQSKRIKKHKNLFIVGFNFSELTRQIINVFEIFLKEKSIDIPNKERDYKSDKSILFGSDYAQIEEEVDETLKCWAAQSQELYDGKRIFILGIEEEDLLEFTGQIIETFEDFLETKGIDIPNDEKSDSDDPAILYGTDYGWIQEEVMGTVKNWSFVISNQNDHKEKEE